MDGSLGAFTNWPLINQVTLIGDGVYPSPDGMTVATDTGLVVDATDLSLKFSLGGPFSDLAYIGNDPITLLARQFTRYTNYVESGQYIVPELALRFLIHDGQIFYFYEMPAKAGSVGVGSFNLTDMGPGMPAPPVDANELAYIPNRAVMDKNGVIYLPSFSHKNIFRWQAGVGYLEPIPLVDGPVMLTYDEANHRIFVGYVWGAISVVALTAPFQEIPFGNAFNTVCGMTVAGDYLLTCDSFLDSDLSLFSIGSDGLWEDWFLDPDLGNGTFWDEGNSQLIYSRGSSIYALPMDAQGMFGTLMSRSGIGFNTGLVRSPDGQNVLTGNGQLYELDGLVPLGDRMLGEFTSGIWLDDVLLTLWVDVFSDAVLQEAWTPDANNLRESMDVTSQYGAQLFFDGTHVVMMSIPVDRPVFTVGTPCDFSGGVAGRAGEWPARDILELLNECPVP